MLIHWSYIFLALTHWFNERNFHWSMISVLDVTPAWLNNCVGHYNHRYFFLFCFYMWMGTVYVSISAYPVFKEHFLGGAVSNICVYMIMSFKDFFICSIWRTCNGSRKYWLMGFDVNFIFMDTLWKKKMAAFFQTYLNVFSWMKILEYWLEFNWSWFLSVR